MSEQDERFSKVFSDSRFRTFRKKDKKTKIDTRFKSMFTDDKFRLQYSMDKRGRSKKHLIAEDYKKFYNLEDEEEEGEETEKTEKKEPKTKVVDSIEADNEDENEDEGVDEEEDVSEDEGEDDEEDEENYDEEEEDENDKLEGDFDQANVSKDLTHKFGYHRGFNDEEDASSSSSSSSSESEAEDEEEDLEHEWGELDKDAPKTDDVSRRLAICNADWDKINAQDLYVLLNSFKPATGSIHYVRIYYSQFGLERMKVEEVKGPSEFIFGKSNLIQTFEGDEQSDQEKEEDADDQNDEEEEKKDKDGDDEEEEEETTDTKTTEKFRKYQLERLKYFYAVAELDTTSTAEAIYAELDGLEYESSATTLDIRFIPDDMDFEDVKLKEECQSMPSATAYQPPTFVNTALQQSKVKLTWDETDHKRKATFEKAFDKDLHEDDLKAYIASSSSEGEDEQFEMNENLKDADKINKYKELLQAINKKDDDFEMEVTWDPNLKATTEDLIQHKDVDQKGSKKKKAVAQMEDAESDDEDDQDNEDSDDDDNEDDDVDDSESQEEEEKPMKSKKWKTKKRKQRDQEETEVDSNLDLLMLDVEPNDKARKHFNYKSIVENHGKKNKKTKVEEIEDGFKVCCCLVVLHQCGRQSDWNDFYHSLHLLFISLMTRFNFSIVRCR